MDAKDASQETLLSESHLAEESHETAQRVQDIFFPYQHVLYGFFRSSEELTDSSQSHANKSSVACIVWGIIYFLQIYSEIYQYKLIFITKLSSQPELDL